ncbi:hypothetical protein AML37_05870 [Escherichia coli]|nr:hypothetical protein AML37_05870 [Escherichia coli]
MPGLSLVLKVLANAKLPDALRLSGLVLSLQCRENRPVFSACSPHAVSVSTWLMQYIEFARSCRPDKAFTPHPA